MDRYPYAKPPQWWAPLPRRKWVRLWQPIRKHQQRRGQRIGRIDVEGLEHVQRAMHAGYGVLVTPNHSSHADCYLLLDALLRLPRPSYIMTAWQVFHLMARWEQIAYQHHGCFSVDRERKDLRAMRQAIKILSDASDPLVMFPEGDVFHLNEHVMPFRDGSLILAATAVKRSGRPVACVPCGLKYYYVDDPTSELRRVVRAIEHRVGGAPKHKLPLAQRIERLQAGVLYWRERQYLGEGDRDGSEAQRRDTLIDEILNRRERDFRLPAVDGFHERVKQLRQYLIEAHNLSVDSPGIGAEVTAAMEDAFVAVQLYSYRFGYVSASPTIERIAETVDKLEEDVLGLRTAKIRGSRRGVVRFGRPMLMQHPLDRDSSREFGERLRQRLQSVLDGVGPEKKATA